MMRPRYFKFIFRRHRKTDLQAESHLNELCRERGFKPDWSTKEIIQDVHDHQIMRVYEKSRPAGSTTPTAGQMVA